MEIVAHALWATAAGTLTNRGEKLRLCLPWFIFWAAFPDLFAFTPEAISVVWFRLFGPGYGRIHPFKIVGVDSYSLSHSLIVFAPAFLAAWLILRGRAWPMLGWALHIAMDIPSHSAHYPTPFLWPVSAFRMHGIGWRDPMFMACNYAALAAAFLLLWWFRKRNPVTTDK
jgi:hypothetical protein